VSLDTTSKDSLNRPVIALWGTLVTQMPDPVELEVFKNLYHSIAEEMGAALRRTSFSPNIKERRDYSCAVFDSAGQVIAMGDHMPVHLGSMPMSVATAVEQCELDPGDMVMLNDPFRGGTHLPDITLVVPVYLSCGDGAVPRLGGVKPRHHTTKPDFYVASRAHHADVGGTYPGSMGPCREIYQEGLRIPPVKIMRDGKLVADVLALLLNNVRTPEEREGDLGAQIAACETGAQRLREICNRYGMARAQRAAADLLVYSEEMMRAFLQTIPTGAYRAEDYLDDDGIEARPVRIAVSIRVAPRTAKSEQQRALNTNVIATQARCPRTPHFRIGPQSFWRKSSPGNEVPSCSPCPNSHRTHNGT
jgi:N-methylhydantoinase B